jgi:hypothetical protein
MNPQARLRLLALLAMSALLSACASVARLPTPAVSEESRASVVLLSLNQQELEVDKPDVGNAGGGLIGALIEAAAESYMDKNRQAAIAPIRDALVDFNAEPLLLEQVRQNLPANLVRPDAEIRVVRNAAALEDALVALGGANALVLYTRYAFDAEFRAIYVRMHASFGDVGLTRDKKGRAKSRYSSTSQKTGKVVEMTYQSQFPLSDPSGSYTPNIARWMTDAGKPITDAISAAIIEASTLAGRDLAAPLSFDPKGQKSTFVFYGYSAAVALKFVPIESAADRVLLGSGTLLVWTARHGIK